MIGANSKDGIIYFINRKSAEKAAEELWGVESPPADQLPVLKQMSDMAWGIWRRVHPNGVNLSQINKFLSNLIVNNITLSLITESLKTYEVADGQLRVTTLPIWPGLTFGIETAALHVRSTVLMDEVDVDCCVLTFLTGSPNGIVTGYFLAQHKTQLGGNKRL